MVPNSCRGPAVEILVSVGTESSTSSMTSSLALLADIARCTSVAAKCQTRQRTDWCNYGSALGGKGETSCYSTYLIIAKTQPAAPFFPLEFPRELRLRPSLEVVRLVNPFFTQPVTSQVGETAWGCVRWKELYLWGPPCRPYSILNHKRILEKNFNPFLTKDAEPFLNGARHVRNLIKLWFSCLDGELNRF